MTCVDPLEYADVAFRMHQVRLHHVETLKKDIADTCRKVHAVVSGGDTSFMDVNEQGVLVSPETRSQFEKWWIHETVDYDDIVRTIKAHYKKQFGEGFPTDERMVGIVVYRKLWDEDDDAVYFCHSDHYGYVEEMREIGNGRRKQRERALEKIANAERAAEIAAKLTRLMGTSAKAGRYLTFLTECNENADEILEQLMINLSGTDWLENYEFFTKTHCEWAYERHFPHEHLVCTPKEKFWLTGRKRGRDRPPCLRSHCDGDGPAFMELFRGYMPFVSEGPPRKKQKTMSSN